MRPSRTILVFGFIIAILLTAPSAHADQIDPPRYTPVRTYGPPMIIPKPTIRQIPAIQQPVASQPVLQRALPIQRVQTQERRTVNNDSSSITINSTVNNITNNNQRININLSNIGNTRTSTVVTPPPVVQQRPVVQTVVRREPVFRYPQTTVIRPQPYIAPPVGRIVRPPVVHPPIFRPPVPQYKPLPVPSYKPYPLTGYKPYNQSTTGYNAYPSHYNIGYNSNYARSQYGYANPVGYNANQYGYNTGYSQYTQSQAFNDYTRATNFQGQYGFNPTYEFDRDYQNGLVNRGVDNYNYGYNY